METERARRPVTKCALDSAHFTFICGSRTPARRRRRQGHCQGQTLLRRIPAGLQASRRHYVAATRLLPDKGRRTGSRCAGAGANSDSRGYTAGDNAAAWPSMGGNPLQDGVIHGHRDCLFRGLVKINIQHPRRCPMAHPSSFPKLSSRGCGRIPKPYPDASAPRWRRSPAAPCWRSAHAALLNLKQCCADVRAFEIRILAVLLRNNLFSMRSCKFRIAAAHALSPTCCAP